ncbi:MAG: DNA recombination protein RmuC, partial [Verrucomicrobiae bacterium]|nr:DNA recombination protein RmuC [Verrucomicrobiae bacterium]
MIGAVLGWFIGWLQGRSKAGAETELRRQLAQRDAELAQLRTELAQATAARAAAEAKHAAAQQLLEETKRMREQAL